VNKFLLIIFFIYSTSYISAYNEEKEVIVSKAIGYKDIKPKCKELYLDYLVFTKKIIDAEEDALKKRWKNIAKIYKREFDKCQTHKSYKLNSFMRSNPNQSK
jgi:hypothetical protein